ncbi:MAG: hypothetical protein LBI19_06955 [Oscillospiraceae bacterium]|jgi:hypothetical protein|nr:hypothetical protein [Oscillospiraceae bacterium]
MGIEDILTVVLFFFIGGGGITASAMFMEIKKHRPVKAASDADWYIKADETMMTTAEDAFLRTHTTKIKVASSSKARLR